MNSTVQKKNTTFPTDAKLLINVVTRCHIMAKPKDVKLWHNYRPEINKLLRTIRFKTKGRNQGEAQLTTRRCRTIARILILELQRKLASEARKDHQLSLNLYDRAQVRRLNPVIPNRMRSNSQFIDTKLVIDSKRNQS